MKKVYPLLLAGGSGKRLWPLSRKSYPKQFSTLIDNNTLFQQAILRFCNHEKISFAPHTIITNSDFRFIVCEQFHDIEIEPGPILIEPESKNTAPAILAGALFKFYEDPEAILLAAPSDHVISDISAFHNNIQQGIKQISSGKIVTFGVSPTHPETGYGYLKLSKYDIDKKKIRCVEEFIEKPEKTRAEKMLNDQNFYWNTGIFLFKAKDIILAFEKYAPTTLKLTENAVKTAKSDLGFLRLNPEPWGKLQEISIDFAIMEKANNLVAVPLSSSWSDLGDWQAVWSESMKNSKKNVISKNTHVLDCSNSLLRSESENQQLVGLGLDSIIAIATPDAVLVAKKDRSQDVKKIVDLLSEKKIPQAETSFKDHRPWGWFEVLSNGKNFQVKKIFIKPFAALSLQSHKYRSEHWIIVEGSAKVTINEEMKLLNKGQSVYVPLKAIHRIENPSNLQVVLIEVQIGSYLGEDDIIRYQDDYKRK